jgi:hypothetical protein
MRAIDLGNIYRNRGYLDAPGRYQMEPMRIFRPTLIIFQAGFLVMFGQSPYGGWKPLEEGYPVTFGWENSVEK